MMSFLVQGLYGYINEQIITNMNIKMPNDPPNTTNMPMAVSEKAISEYLEARNLPAATQGNILSAVKEAIIKIATSGHADWDTIIDNNTILSCSPCMVKEAKKSLGWSYVRLPEEIRKAMKLVRDKIDIDDLGEDGKEGHPHITAKYGLTVKNPEEVKNATIGNRGGKVRMGKTSLFENEDCDVLKVSVTSHALHALWKSLSELPNEDKHDEYIPHATLAYLKKGTGKKYRNLDDLDGMEFVFDAFVFQDADDVETEIVLDGKTSEASVDRIQVRTAQFDEEEDLSWMGEVQQEQERKSTLLQDKINRQRFFVETYDLADGSWVKMSSITTEEGEISREFTSQEEAQKAINNHLDKINCPPSLFRIVSTEFGPLTNEAPELFYIQELRDNEWKRIHLRLDEDEARQIFENYHKNRRFNGNAEDFRLVSSKRGVLDVASEAPATEIADEIPNSQLATNPPVPLDVPRRPTESFLATMEPGRIYAWEFKRNTRHFFEESPTIGRFIERRGISLCFESVNGELERRGFDALARYWFNRRDIRTIWPVRTSTSSNHKKILTSQFLDDENDFEIAVHELENETPRKLVPPKMPSGNYQQGVEIFELLKNKGGTDWEPIGSSDHIQDAVRVVNNAVTNGESLFDYGISSSFAGPMPLFMIQKKDGSKGVEETYNPVVFATHSEAESALDTIYGNEYHIISNYADDPRNNTLRFLVKQLTPQGWCAAWSIASSYNSFNDAWRAIQEFMFRHPEARFMVIDSEYHRPVRIDPPQQINIYCQHLDGNWELVRRYSNMQDARERFNAFRNDDPRSTYIVELIPSETQPREASQQGLRKQAQFEDNDDFEIYMHELEPPVRPSTTTNVPDNTMPVRSESSGMISIDGRTFHLPFYPQFLDSDGEWVNISGSTTNPAEAQLEAHMYSDSVEANPKVRVVDAKGICLTSPNNINTTNSADEANDVATNCSYALYDDSTSSYVQNFFHTELDAQSFNRRRGGHFRVVPCQFKIEGRSRWQTSNWGDAGFEDADGNRAIFPSYSEAWNALDLYRNSDLYAYRIVPVPLSDIENRTASNIKSPIKTAQFDDDEDFNISFLQEAQQEMNERLMMANREQFKIQYRTDYGWITPTTKQKNLFFNEQDARKAVPQFVQQMFPQVPTSSNINKFRIFGSRQGVIPLTLFKVTFSTKNINQTPVTLNLGHFLTKEKAQQAIEDHKARFKRLPDTYKIVEGTTSDNWPVVDGSDGEPEKFFVQYSKKQEVYKFVEQDGKPQEFPSKEQAFEKQFELLKTNNPPYATRIISSLTGLVDNRDASTNQTDRIEFTGPYILESWYDANITPGNRWVASRERYEEPDQAWSAAANIARLTHTRATCFRVKDSRNNLLPRPPFFGEQDPPNVANPWVVQYKTPDAPSSAAWNTLQECSTQEEARNVMTSRSRLDSYMVFRLVNTDGPVPRVIDQTTSSVSGHYFPKVLDALSNGFVLLEGDENRTYHTEEAAWAGAKQWMRNRGLNPDATSIMVIGPGGSTHIIPPEHWNDNNETNEPRPTRLTPANLEQQGRRIFDRFENSAFGRQTMIDAAASINDEAKLTFLTHNFARWYRRERQEDEPFAYRIMPYIRSILRTIVASQSSTQSNN